MAREPAKSRRSRSHSDAVGTLDAAGASGTIGGEEDTAPAWCLLLRTSRCACSGFAARRRGGRPGAAARRRGGERSEPPLNGVKKVLTGKAWSPAQLLDGSLDQRNAVRERASRHLDKPEPKLAVHLLVELLEDKHR